MDRLLMMSHMLVITITTHLRARGGGDSALSFSCSSSGTSMQALKKKLSHRALSMYRNKTRHRRYYLGSSLVSAIFGLIMTTLPSICFAQYAPNVAWQSPVYKYTDICDVNDDATTDYSCECGNKKYDGPSSNDNPSYFFLQQIGATRPKIKKVCVYNVRPVTISGTLIHLVMLIMV